LVHDVSTILFVQNVPEKLIAVSHLIFFNDENSLLQAVKDLLEFLLERDYVLLLLDSSVGLNALLLINVLHSLIEVHEYWHDQCHDTRIDYHVLGSIFFFIQVLDVIEPENDSKVDDDYRHHVYGVFVLLVDVTHHTCVHQDCQVDQHCVDCEMLWVL
jgi:hypothetical protein